MISDDKFSDLSFERIAFFLAKIKKECYIIYRIFLIFIIYISLFFFLFYQNISLKFIYIKLIKEYDLFKDYDVTCLHIDAIF